MVAAFDFCLHGTGGAAPSIDTAMHGLVDAAARRPPPPRQRHRDRHRGRRRAAHQGRSSATRSCGCRGAGPASSSASTSPPSKRPTRRPSACILGGHGITAWGATSDEAEAQLAAGSSRPRRPTSTRTATRSRSAPSSTSAAPLPAASGARRRRRSRRTSAPSPRATTAWSATSPTATSCSTSSPARSSSRLAELGTSCPDHFLRTKVKPLVARPPADAPVDECVARLAELHEQLPGRLRRLLRAPRRPPTRPPMRGADPAIILVPGVGMFSYGKDKQTARVAGEFYVNAINVMRGAEALSTYAPIAEAREVPHRVLGARGGQAPAAARSRSATPGASRSSPARPAASARPSPPSSPPTAPASSSPTSTLDEARAAAAELGGTDVAVGVAGRRHRRRRPCAPPSTPTLLAFGGLDLVVNNAGLSISKPLLETTEAGLGPPARRDGQGQLPRRPGRGAGR